MKFFYTDKKSARKSMELSELFFSMIVKISPSCGKVCLIKVSFQQGLWNFSTPIRNPQERKSMELSELFRSSRDCEIFFSKKVKCTLSGIIVAFYSTWVEIFCGIFSSLSGKCEGKVIFFFVNRVCDVSRFPLSRWISQNWLNYRSFFSFQHWARGNFFYSFVRSRESCEAQKSVFL